jgi:acetyltransferase
MREMLDPKTIALIGATESEGTVGRTIMENLIASEGRGIYPVNPKHDQILGLKCYASIAEVPVHIDLAMVAVPAEGVPDVLEACANAGVCGAIVVSAGFGETGKHGAALERRIRKIVDNSQLRVIGPNCLGVIRPTVGLNASFLSISPRKGDIALISQSGALGTGMLDWATTAHIGFSMFASVGSMTDVDFADLIDFLGEDRYTRSILVYMESIGDARRFISAARSFARSKPIIVLKPGRYSESARVALSHTGAMASDDEIYEAAFRRVGVVRVHEVADLFHTAEVLDSHRLPSGPSVAVVTNAGGLGVMATDALVEWGGELAPLSEKTMAALDTSLPAYWSHANPVDVLGDAPSERFVAALEACLHDPAVNGALVIYTPQGNARPDQMAEQVSAIASKAYKPVVTVLMGGETVRNGRDIFHRAGVPCFETPEDAVKAYLGMYEYSKNLELLYQTPAELSVDVAPPKHNLQALLRRVASSGRKILTEEESKRFVRTYGIPIATPRLATSADEAVAIAGRFGYPVVLKVVSHGITHKSAAGGVATDIFSDEDVRTAYNRVIERVSESSPKAVVEGVSVQKMVRKVDYELILGVRKDAQFGTVIVFGAGGVGAEGLADFAVALPPLNQTLARRMMEETRVFQLMSKPPKGVTPPDLGELEELLTMLSNIAVDFPEIAELDINPLVIADGHATAVDARIVIDESTLSGRSRAPHLVITPYPTRYVMPWKLADGTEVLLRPVKPEDEPLEAELLATASEETLRSRFFENRVNIDHTMLVRFTNIDYDREMTIVAELTKGKKKHIIGVGGLTVEGNRKRGEFAVMVHDQYQGLGLGFKLTDIVIGIAQEKGLREIRGFVDARNHRMLKVVSELGFVEETTADGVTTECLSLA